MGILELIIKRLKKWTPEADLAAGADVVNSENPKLKPLTVDPSGDDSAAIKGPDIRVCKTCGTRFGSQTMARCEVYCGPSCNLTIKPQ